MVTLKPRDQIRINWLVIPLVNVFHYFLIRLPGKKKRFICPKDRKRVIIPLCLRYYVSKVLSGSINLCHQLIIQLFLIDRAYLAKSSVKFNTTFTVVSDINSLQAINIITFPVESNIVSIDNLDPRAYPLFLSQPWALGTRLRPSCYVRLKPFYASFYIWNPTRLLTG